MQTAVTMASVTDTGLVRQRNEDSLAIDAKHGFAVLADGMGGYNAGDVASNLAVTALLKGLSNRLNTRLLPDQSLENIVREEVAKANTVVYHAAVAQPKYAGMGSTLVLAVFHDDQMLSAHIGDSRLYRLRGGQFEQLTVDHSLFQEQLDHGVYSREELTLFHPKNLVTRALGVEQEVEVDVSTHPTQVDDIYLLCSDGLTDMASVEDIRDTIDLRRANLKQAAHALVKLANDHGGRDNIAVALVEVCKPASRGKILTALGKRLFS